MRNPVGKRSRYKHKAIKRKRSKKRVASNPKNRKLFNLWRRRIAEERAKISKFEKDFSNYYGNKKGVVYKRAKWTRDGAIDMIRTIEMSMEKQKEYDKQNG